MANRGKEMQVESAAMGNSVLSRKRVLTLATVFLLSISSATVTWGAGAEVSESVVKAVQEVDGQRMMETINDLQSFDSRAFYLESCKEAGAYIYERLRELGLYVTYQNFTTSGVETGNIVAMLNGTSPEKSRYLFGAHYDSFNILSVNYSVGANTSAPGADDDASGVAAVIELATVLSPLKLEHSIMFVAFSAEELNQTQQGGGPWGSAAFVADAKARGITFEGTAIFDMIGYRPWPQNVCTLITNSDTDTFFVAVQNATEDLSLDLQIDTVNDPQISYSDHSPFWHADYPSLLATEWLNHVTHIPMNPYYHNAEDIASTLSEPQMVEITKAFLGAVLSLDPDLTEKAQQGGGVYVVAAVIVVIVIAASVVVYVRICRSQK